MLFSNFFLGNVLTWLAEFWLTERQIIGISTDSFALDLNLLLLLLLLLMLLLMLLPILLLLLSLLTIKYRAHVSLTNIRFRLTDMYLVQTLILLSCQDFFPSTSAIWPNFNTHSLVSFLLICWLVQLLLLSQDIPLKNFFPSLNETSTHSIDN